MKLGVNFRGADFKGRQAGGCGFSSRVLTAVGSFVGYVGDLKGVSVGEPVRIPSSGKRGVQLI